MTRRFAPGFWSNRSAIANGLPLDLSGFDSDANASNDRPPAGRSPTSLRNWRQMSSVHDAADSTSRPICVYVPHNYEPNYSYPLIVWLHGAGGNEHELLSLMPAISDRNYLGLSFRGTLTAADLIPGGYRWAHAEADVVAFEEELQATVRQLRQTYHIHSERIILVGFDDGASMALQLMLRRPEWFGGAVSLAGRFPKMKNALERFRDLQGKRVLIGGGTRDRVSSVETVVRSARLLHAAGIDVSTRIVDAGHEVTTTMLSQINYWVMEGIGASV